MISWLATIYEGSVSPVIIFAGDINLPDLKFEDGVGYVNCNPTYGYETNSLFVEMMNNYGFEQFVTQPTWEGHNTSRYYWKCSNSAWNFRLWSHHLPTCVTF